MNEMRDPEADALFLDTALREICSGRTPPDLRHVLATDPERRAAAAAAVDAAQRGSRPRLLRGLLLVAATVIGVTAITVTVRELASRGHAAEAQPSIWASSPSDAEHANTAPASPADAVAAEFQTFIDRFHSVMPRQPLALRDPLVRRNLAPTAIPVLRQFDAFLGRHADVPRFRSVRREFTIYALVLGDEAATARMEALAKSDRIAAELQIGVAALIAANDEGARSAALASLVRLFRFDSPGAAAALRCLLFAADLTADEARALARTASDPEVAAKFSEAAEWARKDPRRLLGEPLVIEGELSTGESLSTESLRGDVVLVHFWASWSASCDYALADVLRARVRFFDQGLSIVGISCDRDADTLHTYLARHPEMSWPQLFDAEHPGWHALATSLGVRTIPRVFLIDRNGIVRSVDAQEDLIGEVTRLLRE